MHWLLGMDWHLALLLGPIVASTDPAAVFAILRSLPLPQKVTSLLEAESGFNDVPAIILVMVFSTSTSELPGAGNIVGNVVYQLAVGGVLGGAVGRLGAVALRRIALPATGLYPLATLGFGIIASAATGAVSGGHHPCAPTVLGEPDDVVGGDDAGKSAAVQDEDRQAAWGGGAF